METRQSRFTALNFRAENSLSSEGNGSFKAYANVKGYLDTYGTLMIGGCYKSTLADLVKKGFVCDGHSGAYGFTYPMESVKGLFTAAREDDYGLWVEGEFHGDAGSQELRTKLYERFIAGKECGNSIGFFIEEFTDVPRSDWENVLRIYSRPEYFAENLQRANESPWQSIRIVSKISVYEVSITLIPANEVSLVAEVRSGQPQSSFEQSLEILRKEVAELKILFTMPQETRAGATFSAENKEKLAKLDEALSNAESAHADLSQHQSKMSKLSAKFDASHKELSDSMKECREIMSSFTPVDPGKDAKKEDDDSRARLRSSLASKGVKAEDIESVVTATFKA